IGVVRLGTVLAKGGNRNHDQTRIKRTQFLITKTALAPIARIGGFNDEISRADQSAEYAAALFLVEVKCDAAFIAIVGPPIDRTLRPRVALKKRRQLPHWRAAHRLDLDYIGAQVAQHLPA